MTWEEYTSQQRSLGQSPSYTDFMSTQNVNRGLGDLSSAWTQAQIAPVETSPLTALDLDKLKGDSYLTDPSYLANKSFADKYTTGSPTYDSKFAVGVDNTLADGKDITQNQLNYSYAKDTGLGGLFGDDMQGLDKWKAGLGVANFALSALQYPAQKKYMKGQIALQNQQLQANKEAAQRKRDIESAFTGA